MEGMLGPRIKNIESGGKLTGERRVGVKKQTEPPSRTFLESRR